MPSTKSKFYFSNAYIAFIVGVITIISILFGINNIISIQDVNYQNLTDSQVIVQVRNLTAVPNEYATVTTITDLQPFSEFVFLQNAAIGDKLVIYSISKVAILYRPSTNQIINKGQLN